MWGRRLDGTPTAAPGRLSLSDDPSTVLSSCAKDTPTQILRTGRCGGLIPRPGPGLYTVVGTIDW
jgi:hypothetical protein